jgi:steroid delta-isomerase-like uncharacterized protein
MDVMNAFLEKRKTAFLQRDLDALSSQYAEGAVLESPAAGGTVTGRPAIEKVWRGWFDAFPDFALEDERYVVEGDEVVHLGRAVGTNVGGFMGLPATGKQFHFNVAFVFTVEDGLIVRERRIYDFTGMLIEIGLLKAKPL